MKSATKHIVISTILCALTLVVFLALYNRLPASIPVHFDSAGVANSFWPRNVVAVSYTHLFCFRDLDGVHTFTTCYGDIYKTVNALRDLSLIHI